MATISGGARSRAAGASPCRASSTRICMSNPRSSRPSSSTAACCRAASRPRSAIRTRSRTCLARPAFDYFLAMRRSARSWTCACSSRAACRRPTSRPPAPASKPADLAALPHAPEGDRARRVHELPGRARGRSRLPRQARGLRGRPYRRPCAAPARPRPQRLSRRRHPHRPRDHERRGGAGEDPQGHDGPDPRGLGLEGPARARARCSRSRPRPSSPSARTTATRSTSPRRATSTS